MTAENVLPQIGADPSEKLTRSLIVAAEVIGFRSDELADSPSMELLVQGVISGGSTSTSLVNEGAHEPDERSRKAKFMVCEATSDPQRIMDARRLVADRYLQLGFITDEQINEFGVISDEADPYHAHATYYVLVDAETDDIVATSRRIHYDADAKDKSFPLWDHKAELDSQFVERIEELGLENVVEIASLVRNPAYKPDRQITMQLYRKMFQDAATDKNAAFIMACKPKLYENFRVMFDGSLKRMGTDLDYPGEVAIPAMLEVVDGTVNLIEKSNEPLHRNRHALIHRKVIRYMMQGVDSKDLSPRVLEALQSHGYEAELREIGADFEPDNSVRGRLSRRKPEIGAAAFLTAYTAARTLGVAEGISPNTDVDWRTFLGIELATTVPYAWSMGDLARSILSPKSYSGRRQLGAAAIAGGSLIAPYAYVVAKGGENITGDAWGGIALAATVTIAAVASKIRSITKKRREAKLTADYFARREESPETV